MQKLMLALLVAIIALAPAFAAAQTSPSGSGSKSSPSSTPSTPGSGTTTSPGATGRLVQRPVQLALGEPVGRQRFLAVPEQGRLREGGRPVDGVLEQVREEVASR